MKPVKLGKESIDDSRLAADKSACRKFGPCGAGDLAVYLNGYFLDRHYYIPYRNISRIYKRVAMSRGGFSGKGIFASIPYLVVEYDGGLEKQCTFKHENQVDDMISYIRKTRPDIKTISHDAEVKLASRQKERESKKIKNLSGEAAKTIEELEKQRNYLLDNESISRELSLSSRRKRAFLTNSSSYGWVALAITLLGAASLVYGIWSFASGNGNFGIYFALFGMAAIFFFSGVSVLPTAKNNRKSVMARADRALENMEKYISGYPDFYLPARYAHPAVLARMIRTIEEGRAVSMDEALETVKNDLKKINSDVTVEQDEYDEIVSIKPMFLNFDYS